MSWKIAFEIFIEINNTILTLLCHYSVVSVSTYQVSSARLERQSAQRMKSVVPRSGFEPKPPDFRPGVLTTRPSRQLTFWAYVLITTHPWMRRHGSKVHAECSTRREHNSNLISTYQVSSARLERQSAQRMKSVVPLLRSLLVEHSAWAVGPCLLIQGVHMLRMLIAMMV